jgi:4-aminobutyrate aminotransferase/(S)-3-amino-2-methylpropionate transaminase
MKIIRRVTDVPGPKGREILSRNSNAAPRSLYSSVPVVVDSAMGSVVVDVGGNQFIDFAGGIGTLCVGHSHPSVASAVRGQLDRLIRFAVSPYPDYVELAERLARLTPGDFPKKTMFANRGGEAVENAVKIARHP